MDCPLSEERINELRDAHRINLDPLFDVLSRAATEGAAVAAYERDSLRMELTGLEQTRLRDNELLIEQRDSYKARVRELEAALERADELIGVATAVMQAHGFRGWISEVNDYDALRRAREAKP